MPYADYLDGASLVYFMLGPTTVALAVPFYNHLHALRDAVLATTAALLIDSLTAVGEDQLQPREAAATASANRLPLRAPSADTNDGRNRATCPWPPCAW